MSARFNRLAWCVVVGLVGAATATTARAQDDDPFAAAASPASATQRFVSALTTTLVRSEAQTAPIRVGDVAVLQAEERIRDVLQQPTSIEFIDAPLEDVLQYLEDHHQIEIELNRRALDDFGIDSGAPINATLQGITLKSALDLILADMDLTYVIDNEVLLITTVEHAEQLLYTVVYPVVDLASSECEVDRLVGALTSAVHYTVWDEVGGPCVMRPVGTGLLVTATQNVHYDLEQVLAALRKLP